MERREEEVLDRFNSDYLPWLKRHGSEIGERAVQGDLKAEMVILRYNAFAGWLTDWSLKALEQAIKDYEVLH